MFDVGFFGTYAFEHGSWTTLSEGELPPLTEPWLWIDIHDSDITSVVYAPVGPGSGVAYLGVTPRTYFENAAASDPTDVSREASGLAQWWGSQRSASAAEHAAKQEELAAYLAEDENPDDFEWDESRSDDLDPAEVFVEVKTARFLAALGLPLPAGLELTSIVGAPRYVFPVTLRNEKILDQIRTEALAREIPETLVLGGYGTDCNGCLATEIAVLCAVEDEKAGRRPGPGTTSTNADDWVVLAEFNVYRSGGGAAIFWVVQRDDLIARRFNRVQVLVDWNP